MRASLSLVALLAASASAQQPQYTLDQFLAAPAPRVSVTWAPDGKRFAYQRSGALWLYDVASASRRELLKLAALEAKAVAPPPAEGFDWQNRRVQEQSFQWSASG